MWARFDVFDGVWKTTFFSSIVSSIVKAHFDRVALPYCRLCAQPKDWGKVRFDHSPFSDNGFAASFVASASSDAEIAHATMMRLL